MSAPGTGIFYFINTYSMRSHEKNIERFPSMQEMQWNINEHEDLVETERIRNAIQQILDI